MTASDLAQLFAPPPPGPAQPLTFRQGVVVAFDPATLANTVDVGGTLMTDLPLLGVAEAATIAPGSVVGLFMVGDDTKTAYISGRVVTPGSAAAAEAVSLISTQSNTVATSQASSSGTYAALATAGPAVTVTVGVSGKLLVVVGALISATAASGSTSATGAGYMGFVLSGANVLAAADTNAAVGWIRYAAGSAVAVSYDIKVGASKAVLLTGLLPGSTTITALYRRDGASNATFADRNLTAIPL